MKETLLDFYTSSEKRKPDQIMEIASLICHPKNNDFFLGTHAGMVGITRQTHYHVLLDQVGFLADDLQEVCSFSILYVSKEHRNHICCGPYLLRSFDSFTIGAIYEVCGCFRNIIEPWWGDCSGSTLDTSAFQVEG
ncbi:hypothetical protein GOBAR_AA27959 [Gossypium barbadense]|uniref:Piwi domain-containing protein n=1 Tax=Gossypium barbadense TaxID=3634 RepID=A0A2P5WNQ4_GOSBA|nr:hypothetical protein GOBAR_AA27959 [Gossypium barbadense]